MKNQLLAAGYPFPCCNLCYNILAAIESFCDIGILEMCIALVHLHAAMATGKHGDIDVDPLPRPFRQSHVPEIMKPELGDSRLDRAFNLIVDESFGDRRAVVTRENQVLNMGHYRPDVSQFSDFSQNPSSPSVSGDICSTPVLVLPPLGRTTPIFSSIMLSVSRIKSPSLKHVS